MEKKGTRRQPARLIESGGSKHQRVAGGSIGFGTTRKRWKKHKSDENLTGFDEILPDPVKISSNLREIALESGKFWAESRVFSRFWKILAKIWKSFSQFGFFEFKGGKPKPDPLESVSGDEDPPK